MLINLNPRKLFFLLWQDPSHALLPLRLELSVACQNRSASWKRQMYVCSENFVCFVLWHTDTSASKRHLTIIYNWNKLNWKSHAHTGDHYNYFLFSFCFDISFTFWHNRFPQKEMGAKVDSASDKTQEKYTLCF